jgi:hypothetical protein
MSTSNTLSAVSRKVYGDDSLISYDPGNIYDVFGNVSLIFAYSRYIAAGCVDPADVRDAIVFITTRRLLVELKIAPSFEHAIVVTLDRLDALQLALFGNAWDCVRTDMPFRVNFVGCTGSDVLSGMSFQSLRADSEQAVLRISGERIRAWKKHFSGVSNLCEHYSTDHPIPFEVAMAVGVRHVHTMSSRFYSGMLLEPGVLRIATVGPRGVSPHPFSSLYQTAFTSDGKLRGKSKTTFEFPSPGYFLAVAMRLVSYHAFHDKFVLSGACFGSVEDPRLFNLDSNVPASGPLTSYVRYLCEVFQHNKRCGTLEFFVQDWLSHFAGIGICDVVNGIFGGVFIPDERESLCFALALLDRFGLEFSTIKNPKAVGPHFYPTWGSWFGSLVRLPLLVTYAPE